ncbi:MAG: AraC family transcriptional regulator [Ruminococcaceae bacterium]|nr:AraC family transcriptional regulator [Oscillospiraceae bacterium]
MQRFTKEHYIGVGAIVAKEKEIQGEYKTHRHEFYELEYVLSGSGEYRIDDKRYEIQSGMLFFMTPFHFHSVSTTGCRVYNVMFSAELCDTGFLIRLLHGDAPPVLNTAEEDTAFWRAALGEIVIADRDARYTAYLLNALLGKLAARQPTSPSLGTPIKNAMLYLLQHFRENPTLSETAAHVGYAPSYFSAIFKKEVGMGFKEYVDNLRFDYAKKLVRHAELSIIEICRESGFDDYPNFIRRFQKRFGASPVQMMNDALAQRNANTASKRT